MTPLRASYLEERRTTMTNTLMNFWPFKSKTVLEMVAESKTINRHSDDILTTYDFFAYAK